MAVVQLRCKAMTGAWLTSFCTARYSLDYGPEVLCQWGDNMLQVPPGQHNIRVWYNYIGPTNRGETVFTATDERPTLVVYTTRWNIFVKGKMEVDGMMVAPNGAPLGPGPSAAMIPGGPQVPGTQMAPQGAAPPQDAARAANPPAWHPDPTRRHEMRWWDGQAWSGSVSDGGVVTTDPV
jgi:Protein of unknown function (DUF2510)